MMPSKAPNFKVAFQKEQGYLDAIIHRLQKDYSHYAGQKKRDLENHKKYFGAWYELMVYDWLWRQGKNPFPEPKLSGGKPDFVFTSNNKKIYVEVRSVQESNKDKESLESENFLLTQETASFAAMRGGLREKIGKYKSLETSRDGYVICLGLESSLIDIEDVKDCFLTSDSYNPLSGKYQATLDGEIIERYDDKSFLVKYKHVSAILVATRNFTLNEDENKLMFGLIQNPFANYEIHPTEFGEILRFVIVSKKEKYFQMAWQH